MEPAYSVSGGELRGTPRAALPTSPGPLQSLSKPDSSRCLDATRNLKQCCSIWLNLLLGSINYEYCTLEILLAATTSSSIARIGSACEGFSTCTWTVAAAKIGYIMLNTHFFMVIKCSGETTSQTESPSFSTSHHDACQPTRTKQL